MLRKWLFFIYCNFRRPIFFFFFVEFINQISNSKLNPCSCFFVAVSLPMLDFRLGPFSLQLIIRITQSTNSRDIWFSYFHNDHTWIISSAKGSHPRIKSNDLVLWWSIVFVKFFRNAEVEMAKTFSDKSSIIF
jgi:hypothetical protein